MEDYYGCVSGHYGQETFTKKWDKVFAFRGVPIAEFCLKYLQLQPDDLLVDVGCGTGHVTKAIWKRVTLNNSILCVDASAEMLENVRHHDGLIPFHATAQEFFSTAAKFKQNKAMIVLCIHHFPNLQETFAAMYKNCPDNFVCTVVTFIPGTEMPFWKAMKEGFDDSAKRGYPDIIEKAMKDAGFEVQTTIDKIVYAPTKKEWYACLRHRCFQCLDCLSDAEIEEGLQLLDKEEFSGVKDDDKIVAIDPVAVVVATKKH